MQKTGFADFSIPRAIDPLIGPAKFTLPNVMGSALAQQ